MKSISGFRVEDKGVVYWAGNWSTFVPFGRNKANRAGSFAFQIAAREHERQMDLLAKDGPAGPVGPGLKEG